MKNLLVATTNHGKAKEIGDFFRESGMSILSLRDFKNVASVEETGATFEENAVLKAEAYYAACGIATVADDGGLEIDALGGEPGVKLKQALDWKRNDGLGAGGSHPRTP